MVIQVSQTDEFKVITGYTREEAQQVGEWTEPLDPAEVEANVIRTIVLLGGRTASKKRDEITLDSLLVEDLEIRVDNLKKIAKKLSQEFDYRVENVKETAAQAAESWFTVGDIVDRIVDQSEYLVLERWTNPDLGVTAEKIRYCRDYCPFELWVKGEKARDPSFNPQPTDSWTRGAEFVLAGGVMGTFAAVNEEVERSHVANILLIFLIVLTFVSTSYRSLSAGSIIMFSLATGTVMSLFYMALRGTGLNINTLPVQGVGVGIGVDYAIYITDRIRQEYSWCGDLDEGIRRAIRTTGMAVAFTATTLVGGIGVWIFSNLRFQAEMAQLLSILMVVNMLGGIVLVPALFSIFRPRFFSASLSDEVAQLNQETEPRVASGSV